MKLNPTLLKLQDRLYVNKKKLTVFANITQTTRRNKLEIAVEVVRNRSNLRQQRYEALLKLQNRLNVNKKNQQFLPISHKPLGGMS